MSAKNALPQGRRPLALSLLLTLAVTLASPLAGAQPQNTGAAPRSQTGVAAQHPSPVKLEPRQVESFIAAVRGLSALDDEWGGRITEDAGQTGRWAQGLAANGEAMGVLRRNGFADLAAFRTIGYSVMMARAALEMRGRQDEIDEAKARLEAMRDSMPPAQYDMLKQQMMGALRMVAEQPEGNVALVAQYVDQLDALGD